MDDLSRFVEAQERDYRTALSEIRAGRKRTHWIWYVFPQLRGLGRSDMAMRYGIVDLDEARRYMAHPVLGARLVQISQALLELETSDANAVMGSPDDLKLRSCMTLFSVAASDQPVFQQVLDRFFGGEPDSRTLAMLGEEAGE